MLEAIKRMGAKEDNTCPPAEREVRPITETSESPKERSIPVLIEADSDDPSSPSASNLSPYLAPSELAA